VLSTVISVNHPVSIFLYTFFLLKNVYYIVFQIMILFIVTESTLYTLFDIITQ